MKHGDEVLKSGSFIPLVVESLGYWAKSSFETQKIIASHSATVHNTTLSIAVNILHEQMSVWLYNARFIVERFLLEVFVLLDT